MRSPPSSFPFQYVIPTSSLRSDFDSEAPPSTLGDADEYEATCGVCFDEGLFISMKPCKHKICGEWGRVASSTWIHESLPSCVQWSAQPSF